MLDRKMLRNHYEEVKQKLAHRGEDLTDLDRFGDLDQKKEEI